MSMAIGQYYRYMLLTRDLLPYIKQYSEYFTFNQVEPRTPVHRTRKTSNSSFKL